MERTGLYHLRPLITTHAYHPDKKDFLLPEDSYPEWVILTAEKGEFWYNIKNEEGIARFGELILCPPHTVLKRKAKCPISYHFFLFSWEHIIGSEDVETISIPFGKIRVSDHDRLAANLGYIKKASKTQDEYAKLIINHFLLDTWYLYCSELPQQPKTTFRIGHEDPLMEEIASLLKEHAFEKVLIKDLAKKTGMSPVQFSRRFHAVFGLTPMNYINTIRIQQAQNLLLETSLNLQKIAEMCGYENDFYFSRIFKKKVGMSPSKFRKINQV